jgi:hypothetical protein
VFIFSLQKNLLENLFSTEDFNKEWKVFEGRTKGEYVGPMLSRTVAESEEDILQYFKQTTATEDSNNINNSNRADESM